MQMKYISNIYDQIILIAMISLTLLLSIPIGHHSQQFLYTASSVYTELTPVCFYSSTNTDVSTRRSPQENVTYEIFMTSSAVPNMSDLSYLNGLCYIYIYIYIYI